ncbi:hypothetical protein VOLCADRAFT_84931 [Volvox carteri f. nagariensis]|uniref:Amine oxidase domain-containing protein n=1 Tax=Volvox carteri f. nagariensis TaxID=3068 RepID=D8ULF1_VOLCA|nr:uncharacterized protein VOLCADRAFT_84931 [Volvox carteri f. nagariensis]EFJ39448.1 hypothetical protein VOLCADRAFT_84931 [Volvox carteri f. nagariensis]|eukprot:XP_002959487.1 hypothetical protein VOLCADRAFT_84931 [Volvox carteri f. nagariensis]
MLRKHIGSRPTWTKSRARSSPAIKVRCQASSTASKPAPPRLQLTGDARSHETDIVVIGSGIGGLCCAGMLAKYGYKVTVCESHSIPGGAAHAWVRDGFHFESGPSLYSGMAGRGKEANPLGHVLTALGVDLDLIRYNTWNVVVPEGTFLTRIGNDNFYEVLKQIRGPEAVAEWSRLQEAMRPLAKAAALMPPAAFRYDPGVLVTAIARYLPALLQSGGRTPKFPPPQQHLLQVRRHQPKPVFHSSRFPRLSPPLPADLCPPSPPFPPAPQAYMFNEWYRPDCFLEFPRGGSQALVQGLVTGLERHGGRLMLSSHVERVNLDSKGAASSVSLRGGGTIKARKAVISNASAWDTLKLLPPDRLPDQWRRSRQSTPACPSFMHLHVGFDGKDLDPALELHHIVVNTWEGGVTAPQNVVLVSIPSVMDPAMAPPGKHCLHAYLPATEPYELWKGLDRRSPEYAALKEERSQVLWAGVEKVIPDIRKRAELVMVGTPLTHERFLRRHRGTYGPAIEAGKGFFPGPTTPIPGLYCCGDSTFPGIGLPAVAASGAICANTLVPVWDHWKLLDEIGV